jgi:hypothetical protein
MSEYEIPVTVTDVSHCGHRRTLSVENLYEGHHGGLYFYDGEVYESWVESGCPEGARKDSLPREITSDDKRVEFCLSERQARELHRALGEHIKKWDRPSS